jgi:dienelactone hydrolase
VLAVLLGAGLAGTAANARAAALVNPVAQADNLAVSQEREAQFGSPSFEAEMLAATSAYQRQRLHAIRADRGRHPNPNWCTTVGGCPIDPRLQNFAGEGGLVEPVVFTARSGATLSGHVWATKAGPAKRPGVAIINGSVVGYEQAYWYAAQALARDGYVVLTFDVQGEGMSDQFGASPDRLEGAFAGTPVLGPQLGGSGIPFYDGGEDAINFFLSTPSHRYEPVPSATTGTSHAAKQNLRVKQRFDNAYNPLWKLLDPSEIGVAGHSYGAEAASWIGQADPRVKALVAWDNLCVPTSPSPTEVLAIASAPINTSAGGLFGLPTECFGAPAGPAPRITKPGLGISSDYLLTPEPYTVTPNPKAKEQASLDYTTAGVDSGQIVIRGGTHFEFGDVPTGAIPASRRGIDLATWYTLAWFDRYLKGEPSADQRLLSTRWRADEVAGEVDPSHDPSLYSYLYDSRLDIHLTNGQASDCEQLAGACPGQVAPAGDCGPTDFGYLPVDLGQAPPVACSSSRTSARRR